MKDRFNLSRFVRAQDSAYAPLLRELFTGQRGSHHIWCIFPQLAVLGRCNIARYYGLSGLEEAVAYWQHPLLGVRLRDCIAALLKSEGKSVLDYVDQVDALELHACLSLFLVVAPDDQGLQAALQRFFASAIDGLTLDILEQDGVVLPSAWARATPRPIRMAPKTQWLPSYRYSEDFMNL